MLKLLQINNTKDFFQYFSNNTSDELTIVSPNPGLADMVRNTFAQGNQVVNSVTISKFIKDELLKLNIDDLADKYRGKSELLIILGAIWTKIGRESNTTKFKTAFNLVTEIRSFSLSEQVLDSVLENYDQEIAESVIWIHRFLEQLDIIDEHRSYFILSEKLRDSDLPVDYPKERNIIFYGFDFLAGSQVDLLRSLGLRDDVYIPIYKAALEKSSNLDWVNWFDEHNTEKIDISTDETIINNIKMSQFPKGYLNKYLKEEDLTNSSIVLGTKDLEREFIQEIPNEGLKFKSSFNIFDAQYSMSSNVLSEFIGEEKVSLEETRDFINQEIQYCIKTQSFLNLKCNLLLLNKINYWASLSEDNKELGKFELYLIKEAAALDLPRVNYTNLSQNIHTNLYSLKQIEEIKNQDSLIVFSSNYPTLSSGGIRYTENVELYLGSIGPLRRADFEFELLKAKVKEFMQDNNVSILLEHGLLEHDLALSTIFDEIQTEELEKKIEFNSNQYSFSPKVQSYSLESLSASKLQKYLDCPRKFYFQYVEKISPSIVFPSDISILELGSIEHAIIENYFKSKSSVEYDENLHESIIRKEFEKVLGDREISKSSEQEYFIEFLNYTKPAISFLLDLKRSSKAELKFEFPFKTNKDGISYRGSVDCLVKAADLNLIIDFKRSNTVFKTYKLIQDFEQIQLWFYLSRMNEIEKIDFNQLAIGYIDLSDFKNSTFFTGNEQVKNNLKENYNLAKICVLEEFENDLSAYEKLEINTISKINNEKEYYPIPRDAGACRYCSIEKICSKGEAHA